MSEILTIAELKKRVEKAESIQHALNIYTKSLGKRLLVFLPIILFIVSIITIVAEDRSTKLLLSYILIVVLMVFFLNSVLIFAHSLKTQKVFELRQKYETKLGKPISSMRGFESIRINLSNTRKQVKVAIFISFVCFLVYIGWILLSICSTNQELISTIEIIAI